MSILSKFMDIGPFSWKVQTISCWYKGIYKWWIFLVFNKKILKTLINSITSTFMDIQEIFLECLFCCEWFLRNGAKLKFFHLWVIENRILSQIKYIYYLILKKCVFYEKSYFIFESDKYFSENVLIFFWKRPIMYL